MEAVLLAFTGLRDSFERAPTKTLSLRPSSGAAAPPAPRDWLGSALLSSTCARAVSAAREATAAAASATQGNTHLLCRFTNFPSIVCGPVLITCSAMASDSSLTKAKPRGLFVSAWTGRMHSFTVPYLEKYVISDSWLDHDAH